MSKVLILIIFFTIVSLGLYSQRSTLEVTFTALDSVAWVQLDSIKIMNRTQGGDTVLSWPDTVLLFNYVGTPEIPAENSTFRVFQNYPNPVANQTKVSLYVPEKDRVNIVITDIMGRIILDFERILDQGENTFLFNPGGGNLYFFRAQWRDKRSSIKIVSMFSGGGACSLAYNSSNQAVPVLKTAEDIREFTFSQDDQLLCIGYADTLQSGILDFPEENTTCTFQFATNIPCLDTPIVEYDGHVYNTIQIFSQCWLKENLNVGTMIQGNEDMTDNGIMEKYCYEDDTNNCSRYGGLYQWKEMMQYTTQQGTQGICPSGWHLPTDEEWKLLEGAVDSQFRFGDNNWDDAGYRGFDAGMNLKTTNDWGGTNNGTDLFGFSGLPGGCRNYFGIFVQDGHGGFWWASTELSYYDSWRRYIYYYYQDVERDDCSKKEGHSVRCLRDY